MVLFGAQTASRGAISRTGRKESGNAIFERGQRSSLIVRYEPSVKGFSSAGTAAVLAVRVLLLTSFLAV
jgi:hypothetical protein